MFLYALIVNATTETCGGLGSSRSDLIPHQLIDSTKLKSDTPPANMLYPVVGIWSCWVWQKKKNCDRTTSHWGKVFSVWQNH